MFGIFKKDETEALEMLKKNEDLFKNENKRLYYSQSPELLMDYVLNNIRFLYSIQGLKNYFSETPYEANRTLELECIVFIASIAENSLIELNHKFFEVGDLFENLLKGELGANGIWLYHIKTTREILHEQIYADEYGEDHFYSALESFFRKIDSVTKTNTWNSRIDERTEYHLKQFDSFLKENTEVFATKSANSDDTEVITKLLDIEDRYVKPEGIQWDYKPYIFTYGIVKDLSEAIDKHLQERLDIKIDDINLGFYEAKYPIRSYASDKKLSVFQLLIDKSQRKVDKKYQSIEIKLKNETRSISGIDVAHILNELIFKHNVKPELKYLF